MAENYTVTDQTEVIELAPNGSPGKAVQITFKTIPHEVTGTVTIPLADFNAENARKALEKAAAEREAVAEL